MRSTLAVSLFVVFLVPGIEGLALDESDSQRSCETILSGLQHKSGEDLHEFLTSLDRGLDKTELSDAQIDSILKELRRIEANDPFSKYIEFKGPKRLRYPNRESAEEKIFRFKFQKISNGLRRMPTKQRVTAIFGYMINPPVPGYSTVHLFTGELVEAGAQSVPYILQQAHEYPVFQRYVAQALSKIGDPIGIDYIIEILHTSGERASMARAEAATLLGSFKEERVVDVLIDALQDPSYERCDRNMPAQIVSPSTHQAYIGRYYNVQHAAATSLTKITGKDWGLLYNEDYKTWKSWRVSKTQESFSPCKVQRNDDDFGTLMESLYHRYMSARPNPYQPQNDLQTEEGIEVIAKDLECLGTRVVPVLLKQCQARIKETPAWSDELRGWTKKLLQLLPWPEAGQATVSLSEGFTNKSGERTKSLE